MTTTIYDELRRLYQRCPGMRLDEDLHRFLKSGYIFSGPNYFIMGERVGMGWFIYAAIGRGSLQYFASLMPYYLPFIGWAREQRGRREVSWHRTERIFERLNMKLTSEQQFEKCRYAAANLVAQYRALAPNGFDPQALGGGMPKPPKPPAPPSQDQAAKNLLGTGVKRKPFGFDQTMTQNAGSLGNPGQSAAGPKTLLGS